MRPIRVLAPAVLSAALLLTGCSDEVDGSASPATTGSPSSSSSSSSSSSPSAGGGEFDEFCTDGEQVFGEVDEAFDDAEGMGVEALVAALQQAVDAFDALEPPAEIADDWEESRTGFADLRDAVAAIDPAAPDAEQQALELIADAQSFVGPAFERVGTWIDENCPNS
ncbi:MULTISPECIES: hypothetical protein [unclassified Blastococcus]